MLCPKCEVVELTMTDRQGIEIDYCRACRGVWLDKDELDKIIERTLQFGGKPETVAPTGRQREDREDRQDREYRRYDHDDDRHKKRKKSSFLGEIFDIFD